MKKNVETKEYQAPVMDVRYVNTEQGFALTGLADDPGEEGYSDGGSLAPSWF